VPQGLISGTDGEKRDLAPLAAGRLFTLKRFCTGWLK